MAGVTGAGGSDGDFGAGARGCTSEGGGVDTSGGLMDSDVWVDLG